MKKSPLYNVKKGTEVLISTKIRIKNKIKEETKERRTLKKTIATYTSSKMSILAFLNSTAKDLKYPFFIHLALCPRKILFASFK